VKVRVQNIYGNAIPVRSHAFPHDYTPGYNVEVLYLLVFMNKGTTYLLTNYHLYILINSLYRQIYRYM